MNRQERRHPFAKGRAGYTLPIAHIALSPLHIQGQIEAAFDYDLEFQAQGASELWDSCVLNLNDWEEFWQPVTIDGVCYTHLPGGVCTMLPARSMLSVVL